MNTLEFHLLFAKCVRTDSDQNQGWETFPAVDLDRFASCKLFLKSLDFAHAVDGFFVGCTRVHLEQSF